MKESFTPSLTDYIKSRLKNLSNEDLKKVIDFCQDGLSPCYVAYYKNTKDHSPYTIYSIYNLIEEHEHLEKKKKTYLERLTKQNEINETIKSQIENSKALYELEEHFFKFKRPSNSKVYKAKKAGLEAFADWILEAGKNSNTSQEEVSIETKAKEFQNVPMGFTTYDEILKATQLILTQRVLSHKKLREGIKKKLWAHGAIVIQAGAKLKKKSKYASLIGEKASFKTFSSPRNVYRFFQIMRGNKESELKFQLEFPEPPCIEDIKSFFGFKDNSISSTFLSYCTKASLNTHLIPSLLNEIYDEIREKNEKKVLEIFSSKIKKGFLRSGLGQKPLLSVWTQNDGSSTMALIGKDGELISHTDLNLSKKEELKKLIENLTEKISIKALVVNRGYKKAYSIFKEILQSPPFPLIMMDEPNAIALAKQESEKTTPLNLALCLGKLFQNPFLQLSKLNPCSSFGNPFNQITPEKIEKVFQRHFEEALAEKGLDINLAQLSTLERVCGLNKELAERLIKERPFKNLNELSPFLDEKSFKESTCFLRVFGGDHILDETPLALRHYAATLDILKSLKLKPEEIFHINFKEKVEPEKERWIKILGQDDFYEIVTTLEKVKKDKSLPHELKTFQFSEGLERIEDLKEKEIYWGQIQSVTPFGFFIDLGIDTNGFIPLSAFISQGIKNPLKYLSQGDWMKVSLNKKDMEKRQFSLNAFFQGKSFHAHQKRDPLYKSHTQNKSKKSYKGKNQKKHHKKSRKKTKPTQKGFKEKESFNNPFEALSQITKKN